MLGSFPLSVNTRLVPISHRFPLSMNSVFLLSPTSITAMEVAVQHRRRRAHEFRKVSPGRKMVWTEPKPTKAAVVAADRVKVPVVYYLSRNGHLEHPHFMEVSLSSPHGLRLRDVTRRLDSLRGRGMAALYSWSSKRGYKNGFVWQDLCDDDLIPPAHGNEYVLKGSELPRVGAVPEEEDPVPVRDDSGVSTHRKKNRVGAARRGSFDLNEYKVYKNRLAPESWAAMRNADASTQTEVREEGEENPVAELERSEISPPCSSSSSDGTLEALIKADGRIVPVDAAAAGAENVVDNKDESVPRSRRIRSPAALMQLISCGSVSVKEKARFSIASHIKGRLPRAMSGLAAAKGSKGSVTGTMSTPAVELEEKEYFSGSLIEIKKKADDAIGEFSGLRRSSSCNAERGLKVELKEKEMDGVRARCIPRRPRVAARRGAAASGGGAGESVSGRGTDEATQT